MRPIDRGSVQRYTRRVSQDPLKPDRPQPDQRLVLSDYLGAAMADAVYGKLSDGSVAGEIPSCIGVIAFAASRAECETKLRSVLEGWMLLGLQLGHRLPVLREIDPNRPQEVLAARAS